MHTHYKGTGKVHSFRGLIEDQGQIKIRIQGSVGATAWRITKFQAMGAGDANYESFVQVWRNEQSSIPATGAPDFRDDQLLACLLYTQSTSGAGNPEDLNVVFDNALFNRDIFVTHSESAGTASINYYIELEEVTISKIAMAQLAVAAARRTN